MAWQYLTADDLIQLNRDHGGPGAGVRDRNGIEAAAARPFAEFGGVLLFPSTWEKAAALFDSLASTQYFLDGNKRTAWAAAEASLALNHLELGDIDTDEAEAFVYAVVNHELEILDIARWLVDHGPPLTMALDEDGECRLCGAEGPLPGTEFENRMWLRATGVTTSGEHMKEWVDDAQPGELDYSASHFRFETDLVPGVCNRCGKGWLRLLERETIAWREMTMGGRSWPPVNSSDRRRLAAWAVSRTLLQVLVTDLHSDEWIRDQAMPIKQRQHVPPGWAVWVGAMESPWWEGGRMVWNRLPPAEGSTVGAFVQQHTWAMGGLVVMTWFADESADDLPSSIVGTSEAAAGMVQVWPRLYGVQAGAAMDLETKDRLGSLLFEYLRATTGASS